jgi:putative tributyrin esterase
MAIIHATFFSPVLGKQTQLNVFTPGEGKGPFPVFYLLHGLSDDYSTWQRWTRLENYVANLPLIVVMPDGYRGFYCDNVEGPEYAKYMLEDVVGFVERTFPVQRTRAGRCIGGLSMGGYGAMHLSLLRPEMFVSANSHSGAFSRGSHLFNVDSNPELVRVFGKQKVSEASVRNVFVQAEIQKKANAKLPRLLIDCGTEDVLIEDSRKFHAHLKRLKIAHEYAEFPGEHEWGYWDLHIREALDFHAKALGIKRK